MTTLRQLPLPWQRVQSEPRHGVGHLRVGEPDLAEPLLKIDASVSALYGEVQCIPCIELSMRPCHRSVGWTCDIVAPQSAPGSRVGRPGGGTLRDLASFGIDSATARD
jgi:hypothetical protein